MRLRIRIATKRLLCKYLFVTQPCRSLNFGEQSVIILVWVRRPWLTTADLVVSSADSGFFELRNFLVYVWYFSPAKIQTMIWLCEMKNFLSA